MSTKYKMISFGIKPTGSLTLVPVGRRQIQWLWLHVKSAVWLKADRHIFHSGHITILFRLIRVVQMECFHFFSGNI